MGGESGGNRTEDLDYHAFCGKTRSTYTVIWDTYML
jgi:hypothetical protein